jgi:hypothetical protein
LRLPGAAVQLHNNLSSKVCHEGLDVFAINETPAASQAFRKIRFVGVRCYLFWQQRLHLFENELCGTFGADSVDVFLVQLI